MRTSAFLHLTLTVIASLGLGYAQRIVLLDPVSEPANAPSSTTPMAPMAPQTATPMVAQVPAASSATPSMLAPISALPTTTPQVSSTTTVTTTTTTSSSQSPLSAVTSAPKVNSIRNFQLPSQPPLANSTLDALGTRQAAAALVPADTISLASYASANASATQAAVVPLTAEARQLLEQGQLKAREALGTYSEQKIGLPLWQEAMRLGEQAKTLAPNHPDPYYVLAEIYSITDYWALAWDNWMHYYAQGGENTPEAQRQVAEVGIALGYIYYEQGYLSEALSTFQKVTEYAPNNARGFVWAARVLYEQGEAEASLPLWQRAASIDPEDEGAKYYLELVRSLVGTRVNPAQAFRQGVAFYERGVYTEADIHFRQALQGDQEDTAAWAYLARTAMALNQLPVAQYAIGRATFLAPDNAEYRAVATQIQQLMEN